MMDQSLDRSLLSKGLSSGTDKRMSDWTSTYAMYIDGHDDVLTIILNIVLSFTKKKLSI